MAAPTILSHTIAADSANRINPSWTLPGTVNAGELLLVFVGYGSSSTALIANLGFTKIATTTFSTVNTLECWGKVADGTEDGATLTFTTNLNRAYTSDIWRISGGPTSLSQLVFAVGSNGVVTTTPASVAVTTITPNALIIQGLYATAITATPMTAPSGWTKQDEADSVGSQARGFTSASEVQSSAGVSDTGAWTSSGTSTFTKITIGVLDGSANAAPIAIVGGDQILPPGVTAHLSGSGTDPDGTITSYAWACSAAYGDGASTSDPTLSSSIAQNPTFTVPAHDKCAYIFSLTVTDNNGAPSTNVAHAAVIVDSTIVDGVYPRVTGVWNPTGIVSLRQAGAWTPVII